jgi:hypothetical protein
MILIELDARITVPQIVDAIDAQPRQGADVLIDRIQLRWRPRSTTSAAKNHWGDGRHPLMAYETGAITSVISYAGLTVLGASRTGRLSTGAGGPARGLRGHSTQAEFALYHHRMTGRQAQTCLAKASAAERTAYLREIGLV